MHLFNLSLHHTVHQSLCNYKANGYHVIPTKPLFGSCNWYSVRCIFHMMNEVASKTVNAA